MTYLQNVSALEALDDRDDPQTITGSSAVAAVDDPAVAVDHDRLHLAVFPHVVDEPLELGGGEVSDEAAITASTTSVFSAIFRNSVRSFGESGKSSATDLPPLC